MACDMKTCTKCGAAKPTSEFSKDRSHKDGLRSQCSPCRAARQNEYREAHREELAAYSRQWYAENREKAMAGSKRWREEHPEHYKRWYEERREEHAAYNRQWYEENIEQCAATNKQWKQENREKVAGYEQRRRAIKAAATIEDFDIMEVWERDGHTCVYCGATENLTIDHIVPLSKGGAHGPDNLCIACGSCNSSKHAKPLLGWLATQDKLDVLEQNVFDFAS